MEAPADTHSVRRREPAESPQPDTQRQESPAPGSGQRPRLSVAMIVGDEQDVLAETIESIRPIADEIVVLHTGSTEQTPAVARQLGAVIARCPWDDDFSSARNRCLQLVTGDWVLWLDAGERVSEESAAELREFIDTAADPGQVYRLIIELPPPPLGICGEQATRVRLAPNRKDLRFVGRLRETLAGSIEAGGLQIGSAPGRIVRHPRQNDPERRKRIAQRDLKLAALETAGHQAPPPAVFLAMGEAHSNLGNLAQARDSFRRAIEAAEHGSSEMLEGYYGLLSGLDAEADDCEPPLNVCLEALEVFPLDAQLLLAMGNYLQGQERFELARRCFEAAQRHGRVNPEVWHLAELAEIAADCLNLILQLQGKDEEALCVLQEALTSHRDSLRLQRRLLDLYVKLGRSAEAIALVDQFPAPPEGRQPLCDAVRGACMAAGHNWTPAVGYLQSAYVTGCRDPLCLRWLAVALLSNGQIDAAEPVLHDWRRIEPENAELKRYLQAVQQHHQASEARGEKPSEPPSDSAGHQYRLDQATGVSAASPPQFPVVSQTSSTDAD